MGGTKEEKVSHSCKKLLGLSMVELGIRRGVKTVVK